MVTKTSLRTTSKTISNRLSRLEKAVTRKLNAFYNQKIKPNATIFPIEVLRQRHDAEVKTIIRKAVQDSYLEATELVGQKIQEKAPDFLLFVSVTDVNNIQAITNDMANQFWTTTGKLVQRENEFVVEQDELKPKPSFDSKAALIGLGALFVFSAFNNGVKNKLPTAITNIESAISHNQTNVSIDTLDIDINFDIHELKGRVRFTTQRDSKVDPELCGPLEGNEYDPNDPDLPIPPLHRFCRCHLLPVLE